VRFGPGFIKPTKARMRLHHQASEKKRFSRDEIRRRLEAAGPQLRAMILLSINGGLGNHDCGMLPLSAPEPTGAVLPVMLLEFSTVTVPR
jgi:hypothetical protein